jgi:circadian clock protein KaiC
VVLGLDYGVENWRHIRRIEVLKQRGRPHLSGFHSYTITTSGLQIVPRLETRPILPILERPSGRMTFGLPELDLILGGGVNAGTITLLLGAPGVGKTTLALLWSLADNKGAGASVFLSFDERLLELQAKATVFGIPLQSALESHGFTFHFISPVELDPDKVAARLLESLTPDTTRVVIDNFLVLVKSLGPRAYDYVTALRSHLYAAGVTTIILIEITPFAGLHLDMEHQPWGLLADNIVIVQQVVALGSVRRILAVLKMRLSAFDATLRELILDEKAIRVLTPPESAQGVLAATAGIVGLTAPSSSSNTTS